MILKNVLIGCRYYLTELLATRVKFSPNEMEITKERRKVTLTNVTCFPRNLKIYVKG